MNPDQPPWMWSYSLSRTTPRATASWSAGQPPCWGCVSVWSTSTRTSLPPSSGSFSRTLNRLEMQFAEVLSCSVLSRRRVWAKKKGLRIKNLNLDILNSFVSEKRDDLEGGIYCNCPENCNDVVYSQEIITHIWLFQLRPIVFRRSPQHLFATSTITFCKTQWQANAMQEPAQYPINL